MPPSVALAVFILGIAGLFVLDRDRSAQTSKALWLPVIWLWIFGSRELSVWMFSLGMESSEMMGDPSLEGSPIDRAVYILLLLIGVVVLVRRGKKVGRLLAANAPILAYFSYCLLSVLWSDYPDVSFKRWIKSLGDLVMVAIVVTEVDLLAAVKRLLSRVSFLLIPLSVLLIKYYSNIGKGFKHYGVAVYTGVTTTKNILGVVCLLCGLGSLWRLLAAYRDRKDPHRSRHLAVHGVILAMVMWLFSMAHSMTGLGCFLLAGGVLVATILLPSARRPSSVHLLVAGVVLASFATLFLGAGGSSLQAMGKDVTLTGRTEIWHLVLGMTGHPLVGTGVESFWLPGWRRDKIWDIYWWHPNEAHNGYIEVFLNLGWIGICLLGVLLVTGYRNVLATLRGDPHLGRLKLAFFVVGVIYNFTEAGFRMLDPIWIVFLMAIMTLPKTVPRRVARVPSVAAAGRTDDLTLQESDADYLLPAGIRRNERV